MNSVTILIGVAALGFGVFTAWVHVKKPGQLKKLEPMKIGTDTIYLDNLSCSL